MRHGRRDSHRCREEGISKDGGEASMARCRSFDLGVLAWAHRKEEGEEGEGSDKWVPVVSEGEREQQWERENYR